ncbi:MAG: bacteriohemerythrin [Candidatus Bilamarchaeaceae archaeon]
MEFVSWSEDLSVGIKEIDNQHKHFIGELNSAHSLCSSGNRDLKKARGIAADIMDYAREHFTTEESYFRKHDYPYAKEHEAEHAKLLERSIEFYDRLDSGEDAPLNSWNSSRIGWPTT